MVIYMKNLTRARLQEFVNRLYDALCRAKDVYRFCLTTEQLVNLSTQVAKDILEGTGYSRRVDSELRRRVYHWYVRTLSPIWEGMLIALERLDESANLIVQKTVWEGTRRELKKAVEFFNKRGDSEAAGALLRLLDKFSTQFLRWMRDELPLHYERE